jgi:hypothetical protein
MTDGCATELDGTYALLAGLLDQHSEREQAHICGALFRTEAAPWQQRAEQGGATPLPRRTPGTASIKVAVRRQAFKPS